MNKECCINCKSKISPNNWKVGKFKCQKCQNTKPHINDDKLLKAIAEALEYKMKYKHCRHYT